MLTGEIRRRQNEDHDGNRHAGHRVVDSGRGNGQSAENSFNPIDTGMWNTDADLDHDGTRKALTLDHGRNYAATQIRPQPTVTDQLIDQLANHVFEVQHAARKYHAAGLENVDYLCHNEGTRPKLASLVG